MPERTIFNQIQIMTIHKCNLKCKFCPNSIIPQSGDKMTDELYKKMIDELGSLDYAGRITLYLMNEPFLDDRLHRFIKYARDACPKARVNISTNGVIPDWDLMDKMFHFGLSDCDISCYTEEIKGKWVNYHRNKKNLCRIERPEDWGFYNRGGNIPGVGRNAIGGYCERPFIQMYINAWGEAVLCCSDYKREVVMGDVNKNTLMEIWHNDKYKLYREHLEQGKRDLLLCKTCNYV